MYKAFNIFLRWMWELDHKESWAPKKWCFWTVVLEKTLESPLDCRENQPVHPKGNQSWVLIGRTDLKPKLQYFGHLMWRTDSLEKALVLGKIEGGRRRGQQRIRWLDGITDNMDMSLSRLRSWWWTGRPGVLPSMGSQRVGHDWATELNWTASDSHIHSEKMDDSKQVNTGISVDLSLHSDAVKCCEMLHK